MEFVASSHRPEEFPDLGLPEAALVGRSNVGKSSLLNALTGRRKIARVSRTPGRTQCINFFRSGEAAIVDLPGYGYARVSREERKRWKRVVESYLQLPRVTLVVLIVDSRTGPTASDQMMATWLRQHGLRMVVAATKVDKLGGNAARRVAADVAAKLQIEAADVQVVSAVTGRGVKEMQSRIAAILTPEDGASGPPERRPSPPLPPDRRRHRSTSPS